MGRSAAGQRHAALDLVKAYDAAFPLYKETRETMRPVWKAMAARRNETGHAA